MIRALTRRLLLDPVDEQPVQHSDLGRREPDAERVVHQLAHALDLGAERIVDPLDVAGAGAQHRVAELAHVRQGGGTARGDLGSELLDSSSASSAAAVSSDSAESVICSATP